RWDHSGPGSGRRLTTALLTRVAPGKWMPAVPEPTSNPGRRDIVRDDGVIELAKLRFRHIVDLAGIGHGNRPFVPSKDAREQAHLEWWRAKSERSRAGVR